MILQQAWGLGIIGFVVGKATAPLISPLFPKQVGTAPLRRLRFLFDRHRNLFPGQPHCHPGRAENSAGFGNPEVSMEAVTWKTSSKLTAAVPLTVHALKTFPLRQSGRSRRFARPQWVRQNHPAAVPGGCHRPHLRPHRPEWRNRIRQRLENQRLAGLAPGQDRFVFQAAYLIPFLSVLDNVALPADARGKPNEEARNGAKELLSVLEVDHRSHKTG